MIKQKNKDISQEYGSGYQSSYKTQNSPKPEDLGEPSTNKTIT